MVKIKNLKNGELIYKCYREKEKGIAIQCPILLSNIVIMMRFSYV